MAEKRKIYTRPGGANEKAQRAVMAAGDSAKKAASSVWSAMKGLVTSEPSIKEAVANSAKRSQKKRTGY